MADPSQWKKRLVAGSISGYATTVLNIALGLVMFRTLFQTWNGEEFGFWALMWSLFGMGIILDFGMGLSVQKAVAGRDATHDAASMNRLVATAFWGFAIIATVLLAAMLVLKAPFLHLIGVSPENFASLNRAAAYFAIAIALILPLGLFSEVVQGLQRVDLVNWIRAGVYIVNFTAVMLAVHAGARFETIVLIATATSLIPNLIFVGYGFAKVDGLSIHPRHFSAARVREQLSFSLSAYFVTISNRILAQSDRLIISIFLGVGFVKPYQAAAKVAEILRLFAQRVGTAVSPTAAYLAADRDDKGLAELLLRASRVNFVLLTPLYILAAVYLAPVLRLLTGMESVPRELWIVGHCLLFAVYNAQIASACASRILVMSGHEGALFKLTLLQAATNIVLSIALVFPFGTIGVALSTLVCSVVFGWVLILPKILANLGIRFGDFLGYHLRNLAPATLVFAAILAVLLHFFPLESEPPVIGLLWRGTAVMLPTLLAGLPLLRSVLRTS